MEALEILGEIKKLINGKGELTTPTMYDPIKLEYKVSIAVMEGNTDGVFKRFTITVEDHLLRNVMTREKMEKFRQAMTKGREEYQEFMKSHSRPMTEEERLEHEKDVSPTFGTAFEKYESHAEPMIIEFKTYDDAVESKRVQENMMKTQQEFYRAFKEFSENKKNENG